MQEEILTEKPCPYCKGTGVQMLPVRAAGLEDRGVTVEERHGGRAVIEPVHCWKCMGSGKVTE